MITVASVGVSALFAVDVVCVCMCVRVGLREDEKWTQITKHISIQTQKHRNIAYMRIHAPISAKLRLSIGNSSICTSPTHGDQKGESHQHGTPHSDVCRVDVWRVGRGWRNLGRFALPQTRSSCQH
jgi:hypothetical protein